MFANLPKFVFFTGKGGVGKTSLACATALASPTQGKRVLLVSTDPASNVGQVFETEIGNHITAIPGRPPRCDRDRSGSGGSAISRTHRRPDARRIAGKGAEEHRGAAFRRLHDRNRRV